ncbi:hypothetical protein HCR15_03225, partial [Wolbachia pipientis]|nr:hypothetical protein [Wolbachia pipientis]
SQCQALGSDGPKSQCSYSYAFVVQITFANKCSYSCVSHTLLQYLHISHSLEQIR